MKIDNPFDKTMKINRRHMTSTQYDALTDVTDTLDFCWAAAKSVFEEAATPEHALRICALVMAYRRDREQETARQFAGTADE